MTPGDPYRKLSKEESGLRSLADTREFKQRCIDSLIQLEFSYGKIMAYLNRSGTNTDGHPASRWTPQQWSEKETVSLPIVPVTRPLSLTGEIMMNATPAPGSSKNSNPQQELTEREHLQQFLLLSGQETIRKFFHAHQGKMPSRIKMSLKNSIKISNLLEDGKFFPETNVQVQFDLLLDDDQIICE